MENIIGIEKLNEVIYLNKNKLVLLYFGASWCGPCKKLKNKLNDQSEMKDMPKMSVLFIDIDEEENKQLTEIYDVSNIPTLYFITLNDNNEVEVLHKIIGYDWMGIKFTYGQLKYKFGG